MPFSIRMRDGVFAVQVPISDDWTRTEDYDLRGADATAHVEANGLVLEFPSVSARDQFRAWLQETNAKAERGYKTMWP
jgi:hypothetical protein